MLSRDSPSLLICYASQQGNAKAIAEDLHEECDNHKLTATLHCIGQLGKDPLLILKYDCCVFVAATTGDGDPPDTARKLWRALHSTGGDIAAKAVTTNTDKASSQTHSNATTNDKSEKNNKTGEENLKENLLNHNKISENIKPNEEKVLTEVSKSEKNSKSVVEENLKENVSNPNKMSENIKPTEEKVLTEVSNLDLSSDNKTLQNTKFSKGKETEFSPLSSVTDNKKSEENKPAPEKTFSKLNRSKNYPELKELSSFSYTILGLGDTNYTNFCNFSKNLDEILHKLHAQRFYPCGWADDGTGLEIVIEPWLEGLWPALTKHMASLKKQKACAHSLDTNTDVTDSNCLANSKQSVAVDQTNNGSKEDLPTNNDSREDFPTSKGSKKDLETNDCSTDQKRNDDTTLLNKSAASNNENNSKIFFVDKQVLSDLGLVNDNNTHEIDNLSAIENNNVPSAMQLVDSIDSSAIMGANENCLTKEVVDRIEKITLDSDRTAIDIEWRKAHNLYQLEFSLDAKLTVPKIPSYNSIVLELGVEKFNENETLDKYQNGSPLPFADSDVVIASIAAFNTLSRNAEGKEVKKAVEISCELPEESSLDYEAGDTIAVLVSNCPEEVSTLMELLCINDSEICCKVSKALTAKKDVPSHLPLCSSLREIFTSCVNYKCIPKKAALLYLYDCATDAHEKRCLQELVSREGADFYRSKVLETKLTFFDILLAFSSCRPKISSILEFLPRLLPRPYSLTSTPIGQKNILSFSYNLVEIPASSNVFIKRYGICTGTLNRLQNVHHIMDSDAITPSLKLYLRNSKSFRLPIDPSKPIILVGPGTGVAPLVGFLRHRRQQIIQGILTVKQLGECWLFFGCRYAGLDELFKEELHEFQTCGLLTHLRVCYSREARPSTEKVASRYVQHLITADADALGNMIATADARIYVCGDATGMAKDVHAAFCSVMDAQLNLPGEGIKYITQMQKEQRYLQDIWT